MQKTMWCFWAVMLMLVQAALNTPCSAFEATRITVPDSLGSVQERHTGSQGKPLVIHIRDVHCNEEVQNAVAGMLELFSREYGISTIALEGAAGTIDVSAFTDFPRRQARLEVAGAFLQSGDISGAEYAAIAAEVPFTLIGIETPELYRENYRAFRESYTELPKVSGSIDALHAALDSYRETLVSEPEVQAYFDRMYRYRTKELPFTEYCAYLIGICAESSIALDRFPAFEAFSQFQKTADSFDLEQVTRETAEIVDIVAQFLEGDSKAGVLQAHLQYQFGQLTAVEYYTVLYDAMTEIELDLADYPHTSAYISYLKASQAVDYAGLRDEYDVLSGTIESRLLTTETARLLRDGYVCLALLDGMAQLRLSHDDLRFVREQRDRFSGAYFRSLFGGLAQQSGESAPPAVHFDTLFKALPAFESFYDAGKKRDRILTQNLLAAMEEKSLDAAVVVAGGFHTEGMTEYLRAHGYSYVVINPRVRSSQGRDVYLAKMLREKNPFVEELLNGAQLAVESVLQSGGMVFTPAELESYRTAFNVYLLAYAAHQVGEEELLSQTFSGFEDMMKQELFKKLQPSIANRLGDEVGKWINDHFEELTDYKVELLSEQDMRVTLHIRARSYSVLVSRSELAKPSPASTLVRLDPVTMMVDATGIGALSEIVPVAGAGAGSNAGIAALSRQLAAQVQAPLYNNHRQFSTADFLVLLESQPEIQRRAGALLRDNAIQEVWIEEGIPAEVFEAFIGSMAATDQADRITLSKKLVVLENFSHGLSVTESLDGKNQLNLYSVPHLIRQSGQRKAELIVPNDQEELRALFVSLPEGMVSDGKALPPNTIIQVLSKWNPATASTEMREGYAAIVAEITRMLASGSLSYQQKVIQKYKSLSMENAALRHEVHAVFQRAMNDLLTQEGTMVREQRQTMDQITGYILEQYGLEKIAALSNFFRRNPVRFTEAVLSGERIVLENYPSFASLPLAFTADEIGLGENIINGLLANKQLTVPEFGSQLDKTLYNSWISGEERSRLIARLVERLKESGDEERLTQLYKIMAAHNNNEVNIPPLAERSLVGKLFSLAKKAFAPKQLAVNIKNQLLDPDKTREDKAELLGQLNKTPAPYNYRILEEYLATNPPVELRSIAIVALFNTMATLLANKQLDVSRAQETLDVMENQLRASVYVDERAYIIYGFGELIRNKDVEWSIRGRALIILEALQNSPDIAIANNARQTFEKADGYKQLDELRELIAAGEAADYLPVLMNAMGDIERLQPRRLHGVDRVGFDTAIAVFETSGEPGILFEMEEPPTIENFKRMSLLKHEVLLFRIRSTGTWFAVNGATADIRSKLFAYLGVTGKVDYSLHNHPGQEIPYPSNIDLVEGAKIVEHSYVIGLKGIARVGTVTRFPQQDLPIRPSWKDFNATYTDWLDYSNAIEIEEIERKPLFYKKFGVSYEYSPWEGLTEEEFSRSSKTLFEMMRSNSPHVQAIAVDAFNEFGYPDLVDATSFVQFMQDIFKDNQIEFLRTIAQKAEDHYIDEMSKFQEIFQIRISLASNWLENLKRFAVELAGRDSSMRMRAEGINAAILDFQELAAAYTPVTVTEDLAIIQQIVENIQNTGKQLAAHLVTIYENFDVLYLSELEKYQAQTGTAQRFSESRLTDVMRRYGVRQDWSSTLPENIATLQTMQNHLRQSINTFSQMNTWIAAAPLQQEFTTHEQLSPEEHMNSFVLTANRLLLSTDNFRKRFFGVSRLVYEMDMFGIIPKNNTTLFDLLLSLQFTDQEKELIKDIRDLTAFPQAQAVAQIENWELSPQEEAAVLSVYHLSQIIVFPDGQILLAQSDDEILADEFFSPMVSTARLANAVENMERGAWKKSLLESFKKAFHATQTDQIIMLNIINDVIQFNPKTKTKILTLLGEAMAETLIEEGVIDTHDIDSVKDFIQSPFMRERLGAVTQIMGRFGVENGIPLFNFFLTLSPEEFERVFDSPDINVNSLSIPVDLITIDFSLTQRMILEAAFSPISPEAFARIFEQIAYNRFISPQERAALIEPAITLLKSHGATNRLNALYGVLKNHARSQISEDDRLEMERETVTPAQPLGQIQLDTFRMPDLIRSLQKAASVAEKRYIIIQMLEYNEEASVGILGKYLVEHDYPADISGMMLALYLDKVAELFDEGRLTETQIVTIELQLVQLFKTSPHFIQKQQLLEHFGIIARNVSIPLSIRANALVILESVQYGADSPAQVIARTIFKEIEGYTILRDITDTIKRTEKIDHTDMLFSVFDSLPAIPFNPLASIDKIGFDSAFHIYSQTTAAGQLFELDGQPTGEQLKRLATAQDHIIIFNTRDTNRWYSINGYSDPSQSVVLNELAQQGVIDAVITYHPLNAVPVPSAADVAFARHTGSNFIVAQQGIAQFGQITKDIADGTPLRLDDESVVSFEYEYQLWKEASAALPLDVNRIRRFFSPYGVNYVPLTWESAASGIGALLPPRQTIDDLLLSPSSHDRAASALAVSRQGYPYLLNTIERMAVLNDIADSRQTGLHDANGFAVERQALYQALLEINNFQDVAAYHFAVHEKFFDELEQFLLTVVAQQLGREIDVFAIQRDLARSRSIIASAGLSRITDPKTAANRMSILRKALDDLSASLFTINIRMEMMYEELSDVNIRQAENVRHYQDFVITVHNDIVTFLDILVNIPELPEEPVRMQAHMKESLSVNGEPAVGTLMRNGETTVEGITRGIMDNFDLDNPIDFFMLTINNAEISFIFEHSIMRDLGFETREQFQQFLMTGLELRGMKLFENMQSGQIILGKVDRSPSPFVDDKKNRFIGVNKGFLAANDKQFVREAFLIGFTHEMRHEAGVFVDGIELTDPDKLERFLTAEDAAFTRTLISDYDGYRAALETVLQLASQDQPDYLRELQEADAEVFKSPLSDILKGLAIEDSKQRALLLRGLEDVFLNQPAVVPNLLDTIRQAVAVYPEQKANTAAVFADVIIRRLLDDGRLFHMFKGQFSKMITAFMTQFGVEYSIMLFADMQSMDTKQIYDFMQSEITASGVTVPLEYIERNRIPLDALIRAVLSVQPDIEFAANALGSIIYNPLLPPDKRRELFEQSLTLSRFEPELTPVIYKVIGSYNSHGFELEGFAKVSNDDQQDYVEFLYNQAVQPITDYLKETDSSKLDPEALHDALETSLSDIFINFISRDEQRGHTQRMQAMNKLYDLWADETLTESSIYNLIEHLNRNPIHPELEGLAAAMILERLGRVMRGQTTLVDMRIIGQAFDMVLDLFTRSRLEEGKTTALSMMGALLKKNDLPIGLSGRAIQFIDAVSTASDVGLQYKAWSVFEYTNGDWWLEWLKDRIDASSDGVAEPEFYEWREKIFQAVRERQQLIFPIDFETAINIFQTERYSRIQFKLLAPPANQQLELLEQLDYEVLITRERTNGDWLITRGGAETVSSARLNNRVFRGEIDVTGHNHPLPAPSIPSRSDLFFGNEPEYNFIFGKHFGIAGSGFTMWGTISKDMDTQDPSSLQQFSSLDDMKDQMKTKNEARTEYLKALSKKRSRKFDGNIPYYAALYLDYRMFEELGVDLESTLWTEDEFSRIVPSQPRSLLELLNESSAENRLLALQFLQRYRYPDIVGARDIIRRVVEISETDPDKKVKGTAATTISHFAREMEVMERSYNVQLAKLKQWLGSVRLFVRLLPDAPAVKEPLVKAIDSFDLNLLIWGGITYADRDDLLNSHSIISANNSLFISNLDAVFDELEKLKTGKSAYEQDRIDTLMDEVNPFLKHAERFSGWLSKSLVAELYNNRRIPGVIPPKSNQVKIIAGQQRAQKAFKQSWKDFVNVTSLALSRPDLPQRERWGAILNNMLKYGIVDDILSGEIDEYTKYKLILDMLRLQPRERAMIRTLMYIENNDLRIDFIYAVASDEEIGPLYTLIKLDTFFNQANAVLARTDIDEFDQMADVARLVVQSGIYNELKTNPQLNIFDVLRRLNFSNFDQLVLETLRDNPDADFPMARKFRFFIDMANAQIASVSQLKEASEANNLQVTLKEGLTANGVSAVGQVSRKGTQILTEITEDIIKDAAVISLSIAGKDITLAVENEILVQLGFTNPSHFGDMITAAIRLRGEEYYAALPEGKQIVLGIVDTSESLFVDHVNNGFIGVNRAFFEHLDKKYQREMAMIGFSHELLHEAGVGADGEFMLTMQDTALAAQLFSDKDAFLSALAVLVEENSEDDADFFRAVQAVPAEEFNVMRSELQVALESNQFEQLEHVVQQAYNGTDIIRAQAQTALQTAMAIAPEKLQAIIDGIATVLERIVTENGSLASVQRDAFIQIIQPIIGQFGIAPALGIVGHLQGFTPGQTSQALGTERISVDEIQVPAGFIGEQMVPIDRAVQSIFEAVSDSVQILRLIQLIVNQDPSNQELRGTVVALALMYAGENSFLQSQLMPLMQENTPDAEPVAQAASVLSNEVAEGELRSDVTIAGSPIVGQISRDGKTDSGDIALDILEKAVVIDLRVNGKILKLHVDQGIIDALQFRSIDEFSAYILKGIELRGQELFTSLAFDKQIVLGLVDTSYSLVEDHKDNNFIGVNRALTEILDKRYLRELFLIEFTHELRHEAGVSIENEAQIIDEDISLTQQLVDDKEAFVNAVRALFAERALEPGKPDYFTQLKQQDSASFLSPVSGIVGLFEGTENQQAYNVTIELQSLFLQEPAVQQEIISRYETALAVYPEMRKGLSKKIVEFFAERLTARGIISSDAASQFSAQLVPIAVKFGISSLVRFYRILETVPFAELIAMEENSAIEIDGIRVPVQFINAGIIDDSRFLDAVFSESVQDDEAILQLQAALYHSGITQTRRNELIKQALVRARGVRGLEDRLFPVLVNNNTFGFNSMEREQSYYLVLNELYPLLIQRRAIPRINQYIEGSVSAAVGTETEITRLWLADYPASLRELSRYVRDDISYDRKGIGAAVLIEKLARMMQFNPAAVTTDDARSVFDQVFDVFVENKTEEGKILILNMLGVVANNTALPWVMRGKAIQFIEAAQSIPGVTVSNFARDVFARAGGADIIEELGTYLGSAEGAQYVQDFIGELGFANRMAQRVQLAVDTVNFDAALAMFNRYGYTRITFELPEQPTKEQLRRLVPLNFEVIVYRERATGKWFIMKGTPDQVHSKFMINAKRQANIDVSIHNHPGDSVPYPSPPDLVFGNMIDNNFIIGKYSASESGMTQFGIVRRNPETGQAARIGMQANAEYKASEFFEQIERYLELYQKTLSNFAVLKGLTLDEWLKNLLFEVSAYQMYELFGVDVDPRQWNDVNFDAAIAPPQSMLALLNDSSAHNQAFAIESILAYGYSDLLLSTNLFEQISLIYEQTEVEYVKTLAGNALEHFRKEMESFERSVRIQLALTWQWTKTAGAFAQKEIMPKLNAADSSALSAAFARLDAIVSSYTGKPDFEQLDAIDRIIDFVWGFSEELEKQLPVIRRLLAQAEGLSAGAQQQRAQFADNTEIFLEYARRVKQWYESSRLQEVFADKAALQAPVPQDRITARRNAAYMEQVPYASTYNGYRNEVNNALADKYLAAEERWQAIVSLGIQSGVAQQIAGNILNARETLRALINTDTATARERAVFRVLYHLQMRPDARQEQLRFINAVTEQEETLPLVHLVDMLHGSIPPQVIRETEKKKITVKDGRVKVPSGSILPYQIKEYDSVKLHQFLEKGNSVLAQSYPPAGKWREIARLINEYGLYDAVIRKGKDIFPFILALNLSEEEAKIIAGLQTMRAWGSIGETLAKPVLWVKLVSNPLYKPYRFIYDFAMGRIDPNTSGDYSVRMFQARLNPDIMVNEEPAVGTLSKNGKTTPQDIVETIRNGASSTIILPIGNTSVTVVAENAILEKLGFTGDLAGENFKQFLLHGIQTRGEELFAGFAVGEQVTLGIVDQSDTPFVDHADNGFIGVNRALFETVDAEVLRPLFLVGVTHELRHEAGVDAENIHAEESILTDEDVRMTLQMVTDKNALMASLARLLIQKPEGAVDYFGQMQDAYRVETGEEPAVTIAQAARLLRSAGAVPDARIMEDIAAFFAGLPVVFTIDTLTKYAAVQSVYPDTSPLIIRSVAQAAADQLVELGALSEDSRQAFITHTTELFTAYGIEQSLPVFLQFYDLAPADSARILNSTVVAVDGVMVPVDFIGAGIVS
ncbi:hypothetical protein KDK77_01120, partial [bacterium]|nr:hypothetical protein [bacterium]